MKNNKPTSIIIGTGSCIPPLVKKNKDFDGADFFKSPDEKVEKPFDVMIADFVKITGIEERRYLNPNQKAANIAYEAALNAINSVKNPEFDVENIDAIIVATNYGDIEYGNTSSSSVPSIASKVKHKLQIKNPYCTAEDQTFGCPGWIQSTIWADRLIKVGDAKTVLIIGVEGLSRVIDIYDRDGLLFSDGAGAIILQKNERDTDSGILSYISRSDTIEDPNKIIFNSPSFNKNRKNNDHYIHMDGNQVYRYAIDKVPNEIKKALDKAGLEVDDVQKILLHQANGKMIEVMAEKTFKLYGKTKKEFKSVFASVVPMTVKHLGNSSVATIPTLLDLIMKGKMPGHEISPGDNVIFASVGAGMNINAMVYRI